MTVKDTAAPEAEAEEQDADVETEETNEEAADGTENEEDASGDEPESESEDTADSDGSEDGDEADQGNKRSDSREDKGDGKTAEEIAALKKEVADLKAPKPEPKKERSESDWQDLMQKTGLPKGGIQYMEEGLIALGRHMMNVIQSQMSGSNLNQTLEAMSQKKEYANVKQYRPLMETFLKRFAPSMHSNPEILDQAYYYAKGKGTDKAVQKTAQTREINRKVVKRVSTQGGGASNGGKKPAAKSKGKISDADRSAFESFGKQSFKSVEEMVAAKTKR